MDKLNRSDATSTVYRARFVPAVLILAAALLQPNAAWSVEELDDYTKAQTENIVRDTLRDGKNILAADGSKPTWQKMLWTTGVLKSGQDMNARLELSTRVQAFRTPGLEQNIGGVILLDKTAQSTIRNDGKPGAGMNVVQFLKTLKIGAFLKADEGLDKETYKKEGQYRIKGIDDEQRFREKLRSHKGIVGTKFRWLWEVNIEKGQDVKEYIKQNRHVMKREAHRLARMARITQEEGGVPMLEPEMNINNKRSVETVAKIQEAVLKAVFAAAKKEGVHLPGAILKTTMPTPGANWKGGDKIDSRMNQSAKLTLRTWGKAVPKEIGGIVGLSGGLTSEQAVTLLRKVNERALTHSWLGTKHLGASFSRASFNPFLQKYGLKRLRKPAQRALSAYTTSVREARLAGPHN